MSSSRKIKFIRQLDSTDCGTACLSMITRYFGANYTLDYLNELCQKSIAGTDFMSLSNAAQQVGLSTSAIRMSVDDFSEETLPCILHWNNNHFVVLYKVKTSGSTTYFYIADPAFNKHKITKSVFEKHFIKPDLSIGYAMIFKKEALFDSLKQKQLKLNVSKYSIKYIKTHYQKFLQIIGLMILASLITLIIPYTTQLMVDKAIKFKNQHLLQLLLFAQLGLFFGDSLISFFRTWLSTYVSGKIGIDIIQDFLQKLFKLPMHFFDAKSYGDLSQRINDHSRLEQFLTSDLVNTLFSVTNIIIYSFVVCMYGVTIFSIFIVSILLGIIWMYVFQSKRRKVEHLQFQKQVESQNILHEIVGGIQDVKLFGVENQKNENWSNTQQESVNLSLKSTKIDMIQSIGYSFFQSGKNIVITYLAALLVMQDKLSFGGLLSLSFVLGQTTNPLNQLLTFAHSFQEAKLSMDRLLSIQLLKEEKEISEIAFISGNFFFKDFSFKYLSQSKYLIQNLNLVIEKGKTTAIVGESGSGKTTILRLMLGYYSEYEGEMYFGDQIFSNLTPALIRKNISTVMQDGYIFDQSFLYNITLGNIAEIDVNRLKYAIEIANLTSFVTDILRGNLEVKIGINGIKLSGGQKQRILIARAVYKQATYFFFDEATSALDTENEALIMRNLNTHFNGKTVVIVAHRLSTIKHADKIVVMQDGKLVEQGTHEELLAKKGKYLDLIKHQLS